MPAIYIRQGGQLQPLRTPGGPAVLEVPTDAEILEDLGLLHAGGYHLLRLFGAAPPATDVSREILRLASQRYPDMNSSSGLPGRHHLVAADHETTGTSVT